MDSWPWNNRSLSTRAPACIKQIQNENIAMPSRLHKTRPRPFRACFCFCCLGGWVCLCFCCLGGGRVFVVPVWAGGVFFFLLFGRGRVLCLLLGRGRVLFFAVWAGGVIFFFAVWAGDGSSLTYPSACFVFKRPNNKRDRTEKNKTRVPCTCSDNHPSSRGGLCVDPC